MFNILFTKGGYTNESETTLYRHQSTNIKNMKRNEINNVLNSYISNKKRLIIKVNTSSSDNLAKDTNETFSLLYSHF